MVLRLEALVTPEHFKFASHHQLWASHNCLESQSRGSHALFRSSHFPAHTQIHPPPHIYIKSKRLNLKLKSKSYPVHPSLISWTHLEKRNDLSSLFSMNANTHCYKPKRSTSLTRWAMMLSLCSEGCRLNNTTSPSIKCLSTMSPNLSS